MSAILLRNTFRGGFLCIGLQCMPISKQLYEFMCGFGKDSKPIVIPKPLYILHSLVISFKFLQSEGCEPEKRGGIMTIIIYVLMFTNLTCDYTSETKSSNTFAIQRNVVYTECMKQFGNAPEIFMLDNKINLLGNSQCRFLFTLYSYQLIMCIILQTLISCKLKYTLSSVCTCRS